MREFLSVFATRRHEHLEPFLAEDVVYRVDGFEPSSAAGPSLTAGDACSTAMRSCG